MNKPLRVGSIVELCEIWSFGDRSKAKVIGRFTIVRETPTRWYIDDDGTYFRKDTLSLVPKYLDYDRFIQPVAE